MNEGGETAALRGPLGSVCWGRSWTSSTGDDQSRLKTSSCVGRRVRVLRATKGFLFVVLFNSFSCPRPYVRRITKNKYQQHKNKKAALTLDIRMRSKETWLTSASSSSSDPHHTAALITPVVSGVRACILKCEKEKMRGRSHNNNKL